MHAEVDVLIIGGGLAGLTAALHLQKSGLQVTLIEKNSFPSHKVCGEYISNEVLPYLKWLDVAIETLHPNAINQLHFTTANNKSIVSKLPLGGFGVSRYELDHFLYKELIKRGVNVLEDTVTSIAFDNDKFMVTLLLGNVLTAHHVMGAYGKRSAIDMKLNRSFIQKKSPFLAVKGHYRGNFSKNVVAIHHFKGGYCGVSKVENDKINICYLADYSSFQLYKNIASYQENVLYQNKNLESIFEQCTPLFEEPLVISQLFFGEKQKVENHMLMIGDSAGLIHPLCGNGMAMAIHSAKIASELLVAFKRGILTSRGALEQTYISYWNNEFKTRLRMGSLLSTLLRKERLSNIVLTGLTHFPTLMGQMIKYTHGKPILNDVDKYNA
ncbi:NAD(P)/FAD-dependent oxidoreductase [Pedobacter sp. Du54]|uniref:NAD(P)/FAD-dependent oxidoreductase n=1 Tax=Pedobacter anseongensis TaxID=3133439 RepID=UPI0030AEEE03